MFWTAPRWTRWSQPRRLLDPPVSPEMYVGVIAGARNVVASPKADVGISSLGEAQLDCRSPVDGASTVKIVVPEGTEAVVFSGTSLTVLPRGFAVASQDFFSISISPAGALTTHDLPELLSMGVRCGRPVLILLGFTFGNSSRANDSSVLPPEVAGFRVRLGRPPGLRTRRGGRRNPNSNSFLSLADNYCVTAAIVSLRWRLISKNAGLALMKHVKELVLCGS
jgi:hypothetical protein